jgi:glycosyltransferase involved in cell wall biosynthesis
MRFCMVTTFYPPYHFGGDAIFVRALSRALVARGHEVEVVHCEDAYRLLGGRAASEEPHDESDRRIRVHRLRSGLGFLSPLITQQAGVPGVKSQRLRAVLGRDFDVVNFHNISLVGGPGVLALGGDALRLYTLHEHWLVCPTHTLWKNRARSCDRPQCLRCCLRSGIPPQLWRHTGLVRRALERVDALLSPSEFTAAYHRASGIRAPIRVLPTFSSLDPSASTGGTTHASAATRPRFLYVGRLTASKGIASLLEDLAALRDVELCIAGDGDLLEPLRRRYAGLEHVRFLGRLPQRDLVPLYRSAAALVLPSLAPEVFPLSVLEAFACGTPAIVHDAGGSREAVDATGGGFVYRSRDELRDAVAALARDPSLRADLGERARAGYERHYSEERYATRYLDLVARLASEKSEARPRRVGLA